MSLVLTLLLTQSIRLKQPEKQQPILMPVKVIVLKHDGIDLYTKIDTCRIEALWLVVPYLILCEY